MQAHQQIIERFLSTDPRARKIADEIEREKAAKRESISKRIAAIQRERAAATAVADPKYAKARQHHQDTLDALPVARKAMQAAHNALVNAKNLHHAELRQLQLEEIR